MKSQPIPPRPDALHPPPAAETPPSGAGTMRRIRERPKATWQWWEALGVYLGAFFVAGFATLPVIRLVEDEDLGTIVASFIAAIVIVGLVVFWLSRLHPGWKDVLGMPARWGRELTAGWIFGIGLYPVVAIIGVLIAYLFGLITGDTVQTPEQVPSELSAVGIAVTIVYAVVVAPIGEELFFRGVLFRAIRDRHGFWFGAFGSGIAFGLIHFIPGSALDAVLLMTVMVFTGVGLAYIYERRGTIVAPMAAHVMFNVIGLSLIYAFR